MTQQDWVQTMKQQTLRKSRVTESQVAMLTKTQSEISQQRSDGLGQHFVPMFMIHRGWNAITLVIPIVFFLLF